jgi:DMSO/TMAO reductase YedYZ molybdopterin-dependent catalytic subunit
MNILKKWFVVSLIVIFFFSSFVKIFATTSSDLAALESVQITEYEGQDLSSINAFRENSIKGPQHINIENYSLTIGGLVNNNKSFSYDEIVNNYTSYKKVVTLNCVEGWRATILWEGIMIKDLIADLGVDSNANTVIFRAHDGYSTSLPLEYIIDNNILIAYKMNNVTLPPERGFPFQLVTESKWGYKWIKWITEIYLSSNDEYRGFWESAGYSIDGDLNKSYFDSGIPEFTTWTPILIMIIGVVALVIFFRRSITKNDKISEASRLVMEKE